MGLTRVEELLEARAPKGEAVISELTGEIMAVRYEGQQIIVTIRASDVNHYEYYIPDDTYVVALKKGTHVEPRQALARSSEHKGKLLSEHSGIITEITKHTVIISDETPRTIDYTIDASRSLLVKEGEMVKVGSKLTEGHVNLQRLMELTDPLSTELYIVNDIKEIYASQGQTVNSKHIELIVRQMFSKVKITNAGDSTFFPGDIVDVIEFKKQNDQLARDEKRQAIGTRLLLGLTKISLFTESWLSSASFQETVRVLVEASTAGKIDRLEGLKENVIIGRLIPTLEYFNNNRNVGEYFGQEDIEETPHYLPEAVYDGPMRVESAGADESTSAFDDMILDD